MIKNVKINFPDFKLDKELEFTPGVNVVEQPNRWGKTTFINTILSFYTGYFGRTKLIPNGFASLEDDKGKYNLVKKEWIGGTIQDPLSRYSIVGSFFNDTKSTVEQRQILTKFLDIDYDVFLKKYIEDFNFKLNDLEKLYYKDIDLGLDKLKELLKEYKSKESIVIDDITRLKGTILGFKEQKFDDVNLYFEEYRNIENEKIKYNNSQQDIINHNKKISSEKNNDVLSKIQLTNKLNTKNKELDNLREEYNKNNSSVCFNCGSIIKVPEDKLKLMESSANVLKNDISILEKDIDLLNKKVYESEKEFIILTDIKSVCDHLGLKLTEISEERLNEYNEYNKTVSQLEVIKKELDIKEKQLSNMNTVQIEDCINVYTLANKSFTNLLESKVKETGLNIELFETLKNGEIKSTFNIYSNDGIEYSNCSAGEKLVIQIKLALLFIKRFNFDFVLVDEGGIIGKENFELLCDMLKGYQVIFFKANYWTTK